MRKSILTSAAIACFAAFSGCSTEQSYVSNARTMDTRQAQEVVTRSLSGGRLASMGDFYRIYESRLRNDGVGFLWIHGRDTSLLSNEQIYDGPKLLKVCYYSRAADTPTVDHVLTTKAYIVHGLCDADIWFDSPSDARDFADALYVLKHTGN